MAVPMYLFIRFNDSIFNDSIDFNCIYSNNKQSIQSVIQLPGFRSLAQKEEVEFDSEFTDKGWEATRVVAVKGEPSIAVVNLQTKPLNRRRRVRKIR